MSPEEAMSTEQTRCTDGVKGEGEGERPQGSYPTSRPTEAPDSVSPIRSKVSRPAHQATRVSSAKRNTEQRICAYRRKKNSDGMLISVEIECQLVLLCC
ncbi:hypothetical protein SLA2020_522530 [Shorea laevis]